MALEPWRGGNLERLEIHSWSHPWSPAHGGTDPTSLPRDRGRHYLLQLLLYEYLHLFLPSFTVFVREVSVPGTFMNGFKRVLGTIQSSPVLPVFSDGFSSKY
jgi:hypothetical protein